MFTAIKVREKNLTDPKRWKAADARRDAQDEYLEWTVDRDVKGRIKHVIFTCEGPEVGRPILDGAT